MSLERGLFSVQQKMLRILTQQFLTIKWNRRHIKADKSKLNAYELEFWACRHLNRSKRKSNYWKLHFKWSKNLRALHEKLVRILIATMCECMCTDKDNCLIIKFYQRVKKIQSILKFLSCSKSQLDHLLLSGNFMPNKWEIMKSPERKDKKKRSVEIIRLKKWLL